MMLAQLVLYRQTTPNDDIINRLVLGSLDSVAYWVVVVSSPHCWYYYHYALHFNMAIFLSRAIPAHFCKVIMEHDRQDCGEGKVSRSFGVFGLSCIGLAATIGTGVFAMSGLVISEMAGTAAMFSWLLAGLGCAISGASYAELSSLIPASGGPYSFVYNLMGEVFAVVVCWLISLELGMSASAVSRSWAEKVAAYVNSSSTVTEDVPGYLVNILGGAMMLICVLITSSGLELSKEVVSFFVVLKVVLLLFMILMAFSVWNLENTKPFAPYKAPGVFQGAAVTFFAYVGFDEPCVFAAEAKRPSRDVPLSLIITVAVSAVLYCISSISISGTLPYTDISSTSAFVDAFQTLNLGWAATITAVGELVVLPSVALASFMAQPKILCLLARDGLLPQKLANAGKFLGLDIGNGSP